MNTVPDWLDHLTLKRVGSEWVGPCPGCGGTDRFHIRAGHGGRALVGCRGCVDGQPKASRTAAYFRIRDAVFGPQTARKRTTPVDWAKVRADRENERQRAKEAARRATSMIHDADFATHPYLERKGFPDRRGLVLDDLLLVPVRSERGSVMSLQTITEDGAKKFLPGGKVGGGFHQIGRGHERWLCEGLATGLSVLAALHVLQRRASVIVCFSAANMLKVSRSWDRIVADHDESGTGERYATASGCRWWMPPEPGDANDMHQSDGLDALVDGLRGLL